MSEIRWAWRNIVARRWRAILTIGLLALALAATTIVFSAADSLVFRRVAYPAAGRLITFDTRDAQTGRPGGGFASAAVLDEWRKQTDLFSGVHGHLYKTIFLAGGGASLPSLATAIERRARVPVERFNPMSKVTVDAGVNAQVAQARGEQLAVALGLALRKDREKRS